MSSLKQRVVEFVSGFFTSMTLIVVACGPMTANQENVQATRERLAVSAQAPITQPIQNSLGKCSDEFMVDLQGAYDLYNMYFLKNAASSYIADVCANWDWDLEIMEDFVMKYADANCAGTALDKVGNEVIYTSSVFWNISAQIESRATEICGQF